MLQKWMTELFPYGRALFPYLVAGRMDVIQAQIFLIEYT